MSPFVHILMDMHAQPADASVTAGLDRAQAAFLIRTGMFFDAGVLLPSA